MTLPIAVGVFICLQKQADMGGFRADLQEYTIRPTGRICIGIGQQIGHLKMHTLAHPWPTSSI